MSEKQVQGKSKNSFIVMMVILFVVIGGGASAFFLTGKSPKAAYLLAESKSFKHMSSLFEKRYQNEMKWYQTQQKKPVESTLDLSAEWNDADWYDPYVGEIQSLLNNSTISLRTVHDPVKKAVELEVGGELGRAEVAIGKLFITPEEILADLSFSKELLLFKDADLGKLMRDVDPSYSGQEELGLSKLFDRDFLSNELGTYLQEEYLAYLIKELPAEAFTKEKERIDVFDKTMGTEKLTLKLSEDQLKKLLTQLIVKFRDDEKMKNLVVESVMARDMMPFMFDYDDREVYRAYLAESYADGLDDLLEELDEITMPSDLTSVIWASKTGIVKRDLSYTYVDYYDDEITVEVKGTQLLENTEQQWVYELAMIDDYFDQVIDFTGNLTWDGKEGTDQISLRAGSGELYYEGQESLEKNERTFTRSIGYSDYDYYDDYGELTWHGTATHERDSVKATHELTVDIADLPPGTYGLIINQASKVVKKVDIPAKSASTIDLGSMRADEIEDYFEYELLPRYEEWAYRLFGDLDSDYYDY